MRKSPSPLVGEGRFVSLSPGGRGLGRGGEIRTYLLQCPLHVCKHIVIPESQHAKSLRSQPGITSCIRRILRVLASIKFDDQFRFVANKINDERSDRLLTLELPPIEAMCPEMTPQRAFSIA